MTEIPFDKNNLLKKYFPLEFAMAYGSSIFKQKGYTEKDKPIIDFIFAVNSPSKWHENNLMKNPEDYPLKIREKGLEFINGMQEKWTNIYYNLDVPFQERKIKYGVISQENLTSDLTNWETLYVAGRLHKPAKILKSNERINNAVKTNLEHAINTSLLLLPENFTEKDFYMEIAGISYRGDVRMIFVERKKVKNIVDGNPDGFCELYRGIIKKQYSDVLNLLNGGKIKQDKSPKTQEAIYNRLPVNLRRQIKTPIDFESTNDIRNKVLGGIRSIVFLPSVKQPMKGLLVSDFLVCVMYVFEKFKKNFRK